MIPVVINVMDEVLIGGGTILTLAIPSIDTGTIPVTLIGVISTTFTDNGIENKSLNTNNVASFHYSMISKCMDSHDFVFLITSLKQFLYIPKNQLTLDEYNGLIEIVQNYGIKYKKIK